MKKDITYYQTIFENLQSGIALHRIIRDKRGQFIDFEFIDANRAFENITGLKASKIIGKRASEVLPHLRERKLNWYELYNFVDLTGEPKTFEYFSISTGKWFNINIFRIENGYFVTEFQDITKLKDIKEEILEREKKFREFFESPGVIRAICKIKDEEIIFLEVNNELEKFLNISSPEKAKGKSFTDLKIPKDIEKIWYDNFKESERSGKPVQFEYLSSRNYWRLAIAHFMGKDKEGNPKYSLSIQDITKRKQAEEKLRLNEEKFSKVFKNSHYAIIFTKMKDGTIIDVNDSFLRITGYDYDKVVGKTTIGIRVWDNPKDRDDFVKGLIDNGRIVQKEFKFRKKSGELIIGLLSAEIININNEKCILSSVLDITDSKLMEENLIIAKEKAEEMNRIKSNFLAQMSHELRTPMVGILGFSEILKENLKEKHLIEYAEKIGRSSKRLLGTLNQLLDLSIIEAKKLKIKFINFDIVKEVKDVMSFFEETAKNKNIKLEFHSEFESMFLFLDASILRQVLNNLIDNALKYTDVGYIKINLGLELKDRKKFVYIRVEDSGIGIPEDKREIIWESFRQASEGHNRTFDGVGLGLTITKELVNAIEGEIYLEKSIIGKGSTFLVYLPYFEKKLDSNLNHIQKEFENDLDSFKKKLPIPEVLYVEDDREAVFVVDSFLKDICKIDVAFNVADGINQAKIKKYDLILMDINFRTGIDGLQAVEEIRKIPEYENVPIVAITAFAMERDKKEFLEKGFTHYISKPFNKEEFVTFIKGILMNLKLKSH